jgi:carbon-monoxide dehydrogenase medium subunit
VPATEFHEGPYETAVGDGEILVEVRVPVRPGAGSAYEKVKRRAGDWAAAAAGAYVVMDGPRIGEAGIGLTAVGADHFYAPDAEAYLVGKEPTEETLAEAGRLAAEASNPQPDQRGPAEYKRHLASELTVRALRRAVQRAEGNA